MQQESKTFLVYKGLQMPLVLKGFKGRYIYWGLGLMLSAFIFSTIVTVTMGIIIGVLFMVVYFGTGLYILSNKQKKGMYSKTREYHTYLPQHTIRRIGGKKQKAMVQEQ